MKFARTYYALNSYIIKYRGKENNDEEVQAHYYKTDTPVKALPTSRLLLPDNIEITALCDTGSEISLISKDIFNTIPYFNIENTGIITVDTQYAKRTF